MSGGTTIACSSNYIRLTFTISTILLTAEINAAFWVTAASESTLIELGSEREDLFSAVVGDVFGPRKCFYVWLSIKYVLTRFCSFRRRSTCENQEPCSRASAATEILRMCVLERQKCDRYR